MYTYNQKNQKNLINQSINASTDNVNESDVQTIIDMLNDALEDEYKNYYNYMAISEAMDDGIDSETVKSMAYDEYKHRRLIEEIYTAIIGSAPIPPKNMFKPKNVENVLDILDELTESLFRELEAVELYRDIMFSIENISIRDMLFEIITDEQAHADIINYIIPKIRMKQNR